MKLWGARGSLASPGPETARYGGNTSCVEVSSEGTRLILDAGTGLRRIGMSGDELSGRIDILLTHVHLDHIQGLGFFPPLYDPDAEVHIWGPGSVWRDLRTRLSRYLSPPLFPVHFRDLPCKLTLHPVPDGDFEIHDLRVSSAFVCHPGPTVGYRIQGPDGTLCYLPDHEPALGVRQFPLEEEWTSGFNLARDCDLLIHDAQYGNDEYERKVGWGHSSIRQAIAFAELAGAVRLVLFHHDPTHTDDDLDELIAAETAAGAARSLLIDSGAEDAVYQVG